MFSYCSKENLIEPRQALDKPYTLFHIYSTLHPREQYLWMSWFSSLMIRGLSLFKEMTHHNVTAWVIQNFNKKKKELEILLIFKMNYYHEYNIILQVESVICKQTSVLSFANEKQISIVDEEMIIVMYMSGQWKSFYVNNKHELNITCSTTNSRHQIEYSKLLHGSNKPMETH